MHDNELLALSVRDIDVFNGNIDGGLQTDQSLRQFAACAFGNILPDDFKRSGRNAKNEPTW